MKKTIYLALIGTLLLGGCGGDNGSPTDGLAITIHPWIQTRASETEFEPGDQIGLSIKLDQSDPYVENAQLTYTGEYFVSEDVKWYSSGRGRFESYFPYMDNMKTSFEIPADQTGSGYEEVDLLFAVAENVRPNESGVSLRFAHGMSRVVVSITNKSEGTVEGVSIGNTKEKVSIDWETYSVFVKTSTEYRTIRCQRVNENNYRAIIAPQNASLYITVHLTGGTDVSKEISQNTFSSGSSYSVSITIDEETEINHAEILPEGDIDPWENGQFQNNR